MTTSAFRAPQGIRCYVTKGVQQHTGLGCYRVCNALRVQPLHILLSVSTVTTPLLDLGCWKYTRILTVQSTSVIRKVSSLQWESQNWCNTQECIIIQYNSTVLQGHPWVVGVVHEEINISSPWNHSQPFDSKLSSQ